MPSRYSSETNTTYCSQRSRLLQLSPSEAALLSLLKIPKSVVPVVRIPTIKPPQTNTLPTLDVLPLILSANIPGRIKLIIEAAVTPIKEKDEAKMLDPATFFDKCSL